MIFIALGTQDKQFVRLLKAIDRCIDNKTIKEKVVVQAGYTKYKSKNMEIFDFIPQDELENYIKNCDLLITHGGVGTILTGVKYGKKIIGAARLKEYGEHVNNHQVQLLDNFEHNHCIIYAEDLENLEKYIKESKKFVPKKYVNNQKHFIKKLEEYINEKI